MDLARRIVPLLVLCSCSALASASFDGPAPLAYRWAQPTSAVPAGQPQLDGGGAFVAVGGRLYGMDKDTGNPLWRYPAGEPLQGNFRTGCIVVHGLVIGAADDNMIYAVDVKTGELVWNYNAAGNVTTPPVAVGDNLFVGTSSNQIIGLSIAKGKPVWAKPLDVPHGLQSHMASWQNDLIFSTNANELASVDTVTEKLNWSTLFSGLYPGAFSVRDDRIYVNSGEYVSALRAHGGGGIWSKTLFAPLANAPVCDGDSVATVSRDGDLYVLDLKGQSRFSKGVKLGSPPIGNPVFSGGKVLVTNENGTLNMVDSKSAQLVWSVSIPPLFKGLKVDTSGSTGGKPGGGGPGSGFGGGGGGAGAGAGRGTQTQTEVKYVQAVSSPAIDGDSLFLLARDGSVLMYNKNLGVDLTPPEVELLWPNPGDQVAGKAPMEMIFRIQDWGVGVNPDTLKVLIGGTEYLGTLSRDGYLSILVNSQSKNQPIPDGRQKVEISVADWLGNTAHVTFVLTVDNSLPALGSPKADDKTTGGKFGGGGGKGGPGPGGGG